MKQNQIKTAVAAVALAMASMSAHALLLDTLGGQVSIDFNGFTTENPGCTGVIGTCESTWGVGKVSNINNAATLDPVWSPSLSGNNDYLAYMIYGIADKQYVATGSGFNVYNEGAASDPFGATADTNIHIAIWRKSTPFSFTYNTLNRTASDEYTGITDLATGATLWLDLILDPGIVADSGDGGYVESDATLFQQVSATTLAGLTGIGGGHFYASANGGSAMAKWDTNGFAHTPGGPSDFAGDYSIRPTNSVTQSDPFNNGFIGFVNDPIVANPLPEPGSMALVGLGLAGLGALRRRKAGQQQ